jgi:hypothetical protein
MKITELEYSNYNMYNPATGEIIINEECNDNAKSLIAYWLREVFEDPFIKD